MRQISEHLLADHTGGFLEVINPSSSEVCAKVAYTNAEDIEQKLSIAASLFKQKDTWLPLHERVAILERTAAMMTESLDALAADIAMEGGKPLQDAQVEAARAVQGIKKCIETISREQGELVPMGAFAASAGRMAVTQKEPIGPVVAVSAFNHPLNLIVHQVAAAVAAGCPCIVKPSRDTPLSCYNLLSILYQAGLPKAWLSMVVPESTAQSEALVTDARVGFVSFIGSAQVGWSLRSKIASGVRCAFEHGGIAPAFLTPSADLEKALPAITKGAFYHAGQVCVSTQRLYVHRSILTEVLDALVAAATKLVVGDAADPQTQVGPLIRASECTRVAEWVQQAVQEGAECLCGGEAIAAHFFQPTILLNPSLDSKVSMGEVFGPVLCVYAYDDLEDAVAQANEVPFAFQAAVFAQNLSDAMYVYKHINASAVMINDHTAFREDGMPFAGLRQSGLGVGGIGHTINDMQIEKMMVINHN